MDHLDLGLRDEFRPKNFENIFDPNSKEYDFHTFPEHVGWELDEKLNFATTRQKGKFTDFRNVEFNQFLQSWLFFGLMATVLQDKEWFYGHFLSSNTERIDTKKLKDYLKSWETRECDDDSDGRTLRMLKAQVALDKAREVVLMYCSADGKKVMSAVQSPNKVDDKLGLSLMVLGETLTNAKCKIAARVGFNIRGWHADANEGWGTPLCVIEAMELKGWCRRTTHMLKGQLRSHVVLPSPEAVYCVLTSL